MPEIKTISGDLERKLLHQDLAKERDSDEDGGPKARLELDSDFSFSEEEENFRPDPEDGNEGENWHNVLTKVRRKHNTGVKGVRADYEEAKQIVKRRNETKRLQDEETFKSFAYGSTFAGESTSYSAAQKEAKGLRGDYVKKYDADEEDNSASDDEEDFLNAYREQRFQQMRGFTQMPQFGKVIFVDKFAFLDEVDNADPRTFVVTHLYEEYISACRKMNDILDQFAAKHPYVKVLKLIATDASQTLSHRALPAFLVYRNKDLVNESSIGVNEHEFGTGAFGLAEVEWFFASRYGMQLMGVDISETEMAQGVTAQTTDLDNSSWAPSQQPKLGNVNLLGNRLAKTLNLNEEDDDDDW